MTATGGGDWVTIVLQGQAYTADMPALAVPIRVLEARGSAVRVVSYAAPVAPQVAEFAAGAERVTFVAKSLGSVRLSELLPPPGAEAIWVTPLFGYPEVRDGAIASGMPSLLISGDADSTYDPVASAAVADALGATSLVVAGGDHSLAAADWSAVEAAVVAFVDR